MTGAKMRPTTRILHAGHDPRSSHGAVNPPVYHMSTILSPDYDAYQDRFAAPVVYGRSGTPTTRALEIALSDLEGAEDTLLAPSGVAAIALVLSVFARPGAEILVTDAVYGNSPSARWPSTARLCASTIRNARSCSKA
jgi:cystathionine beta-lyase